MTSLGGTAVDEDGKSARRLRALIVFLVVTTVAALFVSPIAGLLPVAGFVLVYTLSKVPLRYPALALMAGAMLFENEADSLAENQWRSPTRVIGELMYGQIKHVVPVGALIFSGLDIFLVLLFIIHAYRRATGSDIDTRGGVVKAPRALFIASWVSLAACGFSFFWGMATGGVFRFSLWQVQRTIYIPLIFLLLQACLPHPRNYKNVQAVVVFCACVRSVYAMYIRHRFPSLSFATTHHDSMLFALATMILIANVLEVHNKKAVIRLVTILPLVFAGMIANERRLVWAEILLALIFVLIFSRRTRFKIMYTRGLIYATPVLIAYVAAGWGATGGIFAPVASIRSMADSKGNASTQWRDFENFNLVSTVKRNPLTGIGLGRPYEVQIDIGAVYELEPYAPHNSVLGMLAYNGYVGFTLHWMVMIVTVYFSMRAYRMAHDPRDRAAAMICFSGVMIYVVHLYGDMALGTWISVFIMSSSMTIAGKIAMSVGAWPGRRRDLVPAGAAAEAPPSPVARELAPAARAHPSLPPPAPAK